MLASGRVLAFARDYLIIAAYLVLVVAIGAAVTMASPDLLQALFDNRVASETTSFVLVTLPVTMYFALLEASSWLATWGKRMRGVRVAARMERG